MTLRHSIQILAILVGVAAVGGGGCQTVPTAPAPSAPAAVPAEIVQKTYLFEIVRYLYRWELDEAAVDRALAAQNFAFWVRRLDVKLDPGDKSELCEILLPHVGLVVRVKKSDYQIEELGTAVKSDGFKIVEVTAEDLPERPPADCRVIEVDKQEMLDYLFKTRMEHDYASAELVERLRVALRKEAAEEGLKAAAPTDDLVVHLAPLSPVANECWIFWEGGRKLFYFSSDIDLKNPAVWQEETLMVRVYDLDDQVVVAHDEAPGSERFLTRNEVGRALYNCLVLGQRTVLPPAAPAATNP